MSARLTTFAILSAAVLFAVSAAAGQTAQPNPFPNNDPPREEQPRTIREQLIKQRIEKERKDHLELLKRGEEALGLSEKLEKSLEEKQAFTKEDLHDLENLEKVVSRIRKDLGGGSDKGAEEIVEAEIGRSPDVLEAFSFLRSSTIKLVDELKKTTRFSISAAAIQTSNTIISVTRFLRLRK